MCTTKRAIKVLWVRAPMCNRTKLVKCPRPPPQIILLLEGAEYTWQFNIKVTVMHALFHNARSINFCWLTGCRGISGKQKADLVPLHKNDTVSRTVTSQLLVFWSSSTSLVPNQIPRMYGMQLNTPGTLQNFITAATDSARKERNSNSVG